MHSPQATLHSAIQRAAEITWWNRQMTNLNEIDNISNAVSFVENDIIEQKGPYIESVDAPAFADQPATGFLASLDYHPLISSAVVEELFGGDTSGSLYQHQAETIQAIHDNTNDNILAVPTATGKTESFFLPILDHCLSTNESGLKSLIIYPMKTLGVDQLNRFIQYLDRINRQLDSPDRITIGIWDSDTPQRVGSRDHEIEEGSYVRGLECPRSDKKLRIFSETSVGTDDHQYPWIKVTRESIRDGVDILLTNPEALDYMFVSDNPDTRTILGDHPSEHPVKHIVFDEAHVWSGIQGAAISLLSRRLKAFYDDRDPQITMVSATVDNPRELASDLTGSSESQINSIKFSSRSFPARGSPDFTRFKPCDADDIAHVLAFAHLGDYSTDTLNRFNLSAAADTLQAVGLLESGTQLSLTDRAGAWVTKPIDTAVQNLVKDSDEPTFNTPQDVVEHDRGRTRIAEHVLDRSGATSGWYDFVLEHVPEVATVLDYFEEDTTGVVGFKHYEDLLDRLSQHNVTNPESVLHAVMAFGRLAGVITEKYHVFLKPPTQVYWCQHCEQVTRERHCQRCDSRLPELQFCKRCHHPYVEQLAIEGDEAFAPVGYSGPVDDCPGCGKWPNLTDIGVPTPSLLSYMLTEICRLTPSKKTLVFSDSHASAESVGDRIIDTEYGLMAESLYVKELLENGGRVNNYDAFRAVSQTLREKYWQPLIQNEIDEDNTAYNFLHSLLEDIEAHSFLNNCENLLESALATNATVMQFDDLEKVILGHELFKLFALSSSVGFSKKRISFDGLTRNKIIDRLETRSGYDAQTIDSHLDDLLTALLEENVISEQSWDEVRSSIQNSGADEEKKAALFDFFDRTREELEAHDIVGENPESGLFTRIPKRDESDLVLLPEASFCSSCYRSYPVTDDGDALSACPSCGASMDTYTRFTQDEDGNLTPTPGYADVESDWPYALDHWAHDITRPLRTGDDPEFITVGIHKGNIPHTLRSAIEEGFRKDDPDVNIVSATPTMELGVDIGTLDTVSQVGIPPTLTNYVQRSGRTGRTRGSSSLVMTAIRGKHPVDSHYYGNLDSFLGDFEPVRVPNAFDFDELLASHVVTETFAYLARNPHESNVFEQMYSLTESQQNLASFVHKVEEQLDILREFLLDARKDAVIDHLETVFSDESDRAIEVFETVFEETGPLSLSQRVDQTFTRLAEMSGSAETNKTLTEQNDRLDQWLARLGYLANYRNFGQQFPVQFSGHTDDIQFEAQGRLYDMFPGQENDLGAVLTLHGTEYIVSDVHGTATPLTEAEVCENDDCERPFQSYDPGTDHCPHCETELTETAIHGVSSVECKTARGGQRNYSTRGLMSTQIDQITEPNADYLETEIFGLPCEARYGQFEVTDFVYAFERRHSASPDKEILRSEAVIEREESTTSSQDLSWQERMADVQDELYRPVGQQYFTQGLALTFDIADLEARYDTVSHETKSWPQAMVSLEQALEKAIAVVAECDRSDFHVKTTTVEDAVIVYVVDSRQGGNGITWQVRESLPSIQDRVREIAHCGRCLDYCDECLLLSRTPGYYLENALLDRRTLGALIGDPV